MVKMGGTVRIHSVEVAYRYSAGPGTDIIHLAAATVQSASKREALRLAGESVTYGELQRSGRHIRIVYTHHKWARKIEKGE